MRFHLLYSGPDGESHWRDEDVVLEEREFAPPAKAIEISAADPARASLFLRLRTGWNEPSHTSPIPQTLICLRGAVRVAASDGTSRDIGPGDVWRMEDTHGKGHHTQVTSAEDFECVIVQHA
ncbi:MAG: cupin [Pseudomonadota bacterium]